VRFHAAEKGIADAVRHTREDLWSVGAGTTTG
jgi:hypothetical protein